MEYYSIIYQHNMEPKYCQPQGFRSHRVCLRGKAMNIELLSMFFSVNMFVHKVAGNWGGRQEWSDDSDPFSVVELYEQGNIYLYQYFCPLLGADTDIFHISQNLSFVHSRLRWVLGQLTSLVCDFGHCRGVCWAWLYLYYLTQFARLSIVSLFSASFTATSFNFWFGLKHL